MRDPRMSRSRSPRPLLLLILLIVLLAPANPLQCQAPDLQSAAPPLPNGQTQEQRGKQLLDEMVAALGGQAWLGRQIVFSQGRSAAFFRGQPTMAITEFVDWRQLPDAAHPLGAERIEFLTDKGMIKPGKKRDVAQVWTADQGYEITYKGKTTLPKEQVDDFLRRRAHSIEEVVRTWIKAPGVMIVSEGTTMVVRRQADRITVLSANNDAVTIDLDVNTHLPLARTFEWRNAQFQDHDEDREDYDDYHVIDGLPTPLTLTRYRNGDMSSQRFLTKVDYHPTNMPPDTFNPEAPLTKK